MDKKDNIFTHKFLPVFGLVLLILSFVFNSFCFAASAPDAYNTLPSGISAKILDSSIMPELLDSNYQCFTWYHRSMGYLVWFFNTSTCSDDFRISLDCYSSDKGKWYCSGSCTGIQYIFNSNGEMTYSGELSMTSSRWDEFHEYFLYIQNMTVYYTSGDIFFQAPPQVQKVQLMNPMEVEEIPGLIQKLTTILVPAGLIIFGLLLAPFLLKFRN